MNKLRGQPVMLQRHSDGWPWVPATTSLVRATGSLKFIHEIKDKKADGNAHGLKTLLDLGMLGDGPKAVRSSAMSEDGIAASLAGSAEWAGKKKKKKK